MKFLYGLMNDAGWAGLVFEDKDKKVSLKYWISDIGDELTDLLAHLIILVVGKLYWPLYYIKEADYVDEDGWFKWKIDQEGSIVTFKFSRTKDPEIINLTIVEDEQETVYDGNISLKELLDNLIFSCSELLRKYGIVGYAKNFWMRFPMEFFLIIKDLVKGEINIDVFDDITNSGLQEMFRSDINDEIGYLQDSDITYTAFDGEDIVYPDYVYFDIAGFAYYDGVNIFNELEVGDKLLLVAEPDNEFDPFAVAVYYRGCKLGYIPRDKNERVSELLMAGNGDLLIIEITKISPETQSNQQISISVVVIIKPRKKKKAGRNVMYACKFCKKD
jgi:hypothetical protein